MGSNPGVPTVLLRRSDADLRKRREDRPDLGRRHRRWYCKLLGLYPRPYRDRFSDSTALTFTDLCRERAGAEAVRRGGFLLWMFLETFAGVVRERATCLARLRWPGTRPTSTVAAGALLVAGIATVMVLARGTGEDITGVVAPGVAAHRSLVVAAVVAAILRRANNRRGRKAGDDLAG